MPFDSNEYAYCDMKVAVGAFELSGLRGLKWKKAQEKEVVYGQGNEPKGIQRGNKSYEGELRMLKSDHDALRRAAQVAGYEDVIDLPGRLITITCVYDKPNGLIPVTTDVLINCEFKEVEDGMNQNDKYQEITLPFIFLRKKQL
ncbi:hypothetical protein F0L74_05920 [Chitinophaga agrisoli]|uniref:Uncharacterized protein n=1 Tax=Chitinophaga agrisoli TaxID=2607653 RepID=A0A5B2W0F5_9BACT|nr:hypothetical protein [Chitinophaga agrisoli]KAA2245493.1 hypothetical protein F0L74_05920 [Chitinophaga agrisoli]